MGFNSGFKALIQYSVITFRATSMEDTNIDVFKKQKEAEYDRQYAKKLMEHITSTFSDRTSHVTFNR